MDTSSLSPPDLLYALLLPTPCPRGRVPGFLQQAPLFSGFWMGPENGGGKGGALTRDQGREKHRAKSTFCRLPSYPVIAHGLLQALKCLAVSIGGNIQIPGPIPTVLFRLWVKNTPSYCQLQGSKICSVGFLRTSPWVISQLNFLQFPHLRCHPFPGRTLTDIFTYMMQVSMICLLLISILAHWP